MRALRWDWRLLHLRPEEAAAFAARLEELIDGYTRADGTPVEGGRQTFRFLSTLYPTHYRGALAPDEQREEPLP
jgi:hypothetical protein